MRRGLPLVVLLAAGSWLPAGEPPPPAADDHATLLARSAAPRQSDSIPSLVHLTRVRFIGLARHTPEQALAAAGLRHGDSISDVQFRDLSSRLLRTGLFKRVGSRYMITGLDVEITFDVEEAPWDVALLFDNFVWFSDEELRAVIAARVPTFDGKAPAAGSVLNRIAEALQSHLSSRNLPGTVPPPMTRGSDEVGRQHVFTVEGVEIPICGLRFSGTGPDRAAELSELSSAIIGRSYFRHHVETFAAATLLPVYTRRGQVLASFGDPIVRLDSSPACAGGVTVELPVVEGAVYSWAGSRWSGHTLFTTPELDGLLGMRPGELADGTRIQEGLAAVKAAYGRKGRVQAEVNVSIDETADGRGVTYGLRLVEGDLYRMGTLTLEGAPDEILEDLRQRWDLPPGSPFDDSYPGRYLHTESERLARKRSALSLVSSSKQDDERRVVDVTITLTRQQPERR